ncbi:MAG TPA: P1 family peptidase [Chloroflexaceae bacterium]|nr:P1 family peptidase [Chloroflexaceae bacterium]
MPSITDVPGVTVGHAHDLEALTGVTVVLTPQGAVGGVDVRGGAPGTRETDLLAPENSVQEVHAVALCGGSAMGLAAATGVVEWLREGGFGFDVGVARVPIVPAAVIFDLAIGSSTRFPDAAMGYAACAAADRSAEEGCVGAGAGATVGKLLGVAHAMKSGVGTWSERLPDGTTVGALAVVNAFGDVRRDGGGPLAGARDPVTGRLADSMALLRDPRLLPAFGGARGREGANTTIAVVASDATLTKAEARKLAQMAQDGLARAIRPVHTPFDGDTVFSLATGRRPAPHMVALGSIAAEVLARAVERAALTAVGMGGLPAARDLG